MLRNSCRGVFAIAPWLVLMGMLALAGTGLSPVFGQEEEPATTTKAPADDAGDTSDTPAESQSMLMWLIETSGLIGAIILVISIFFVHRVVTLFLEFRPEIVAPPDLLEQIEGLLAKRDYNGVYQAAKKSESSLGQLLITGMTAMSSGLGEAREAMDRTGEAITVHMEKRISLLAVIGSLGPMIGLLGTLKGMIAAFSVIATSGTQIKPSEVAGAISEAARADLRRGGDFGTGNLSVRDVQRPRGHVDRGCAKLVRRTHPQDARRRTRQDDSDVGRTF